MTGFNSKRDAAADKLQEPVSFPCCGYTDATAIKWNQFNGVVQCHMCGQVYTAAQPAQEKNT
jgi:transcription elongation factor Elf1